MGFTLKQFRYQQISAEFMAEVYGVVRCPCGGEEFFRLAIAPETMFSHGALSHCVLDLLAHFKDHIGQEVRDGTLPAAWLDKINGGG